MASNVGMRSLVPRTLTSVTVPNIQVRNLAIKNVTVKGRGGRSSVSPVSATVFGSTGFMGRYVVNRLAKTGSQVICPYRGCELDFRHLRPMGDLGQIHFNEYSITATDSIAEQVEYSNVAINLVGQEYHSRHFSMTDANVTGARNIARAAREADVKKFIHVSALGADVNSPSEFLRTKALGEEAVKEEFPGATIIRCANIIGHEDRFLNRISHIAYRVPGPFPLANWGQAKKMPVGIVDVATAITEAVFDPAAVGTTYEFVGPKTYTMEEILDYVGKTTRKPIWHQGLPEEASPILKFAFNLGGLARMETAPNVEEFYRYSLDDVRTRGLPGLEDLGVTPTPLETIAINVLRKFREHIYHDDAIEN
eukprot:m.51308 g.51308  ORF g.51308 m.51308 type:complete len:366 (+) comp21428_c0_seq2:100-1197(+)